MKTSVVTSTVSTYLNMEMAATEEMLGIALEHKPDAVTLVAERPTITTEGGPTFGRIWQSSPPS
jgi:pyridoxine 5-phosphate synthase